MRHNVRKRFSDSLEGHGGEGGFYLVAVLPLLPAAVERAVLLSALSRLRSQWSDFR